MRKRVATQFDLSDGGGEVLDDGANSLTASKDR